MPSPRWTSQPSKLPTEMVPLRGSAPVMQSHGCAAARHAALITPSAISQASRMGSGGEAIADRRC
eukprot:scaffold20795_cov107-Isochrysis_galbana.AAC.2